MLIDSRKHIFTMWKTSLATSNEKFREENELLVEENQELVAGQVEDELNGNQSVENSQLTTLVTCL